MSNEINLDEIEFSTLSLIDDVGKVFYWKNRIFRAIHSDAVEKIRDIFSCGLIDELVNNNLFPKSWITNYTIKGYSLVIEHEKIFTVVYPYEWSFSMLKDAAILILKINLIAKKYGYQTKDCHGFNVVFDYVSPKFVDLGSFFKIDGTFSGWIAYEEYLKFYYYPLRIWSQGNHYIARKMLFGNTEMPHESYLLYTNPFYRLLSLNRLEKITKFYFKLKNVSRISPAKIINRFPCGLGYVIVYFVNKKLLSLLKVDILSIQKKIHKLHRKQYKTTWGKYHDQFLKNNGRILTPRFNRIINIINGYDIETVLELAGNQGVFSMLLLEYTKVKNIICTDVDENAVDRMYEIAKKNNIVKLTPAVLDFVLPNLSYNRKHPNERFKCDIVVALAVTHHLLLTSKIPIDIIFNTIKTYSNKYICLEYMPLGLYDGKNAPPLPVWYTLDWFRRSFREYFDIITEEQIEDNRILFFGKLK